jgi:GDPmannose 4,6-dehydratase
MPRSLILGVNGQDGSYLAETLLARGHEVVGVGRDASSRYVAASRGYRYVSADLRDTDAFARLVADVAPDQAFHMAAVHGAAGFAYESLWREMMAVNVLSLHALLEHARVAAPGLRIVYASSSKIFPHPLSGAIDETTAVQATCLYGIGKVAARDLMTYYRAAHGVHATNLILFHHESARRDPEYLLPTLARAIAAAKMDPAHQTTIRTLDFWIDWGAADEFMEIAADIAEKTDEPEIVLASGKTWHGRDAAKHLFAQHGLDAERHLVETLEPRDPGPEFRVSLERLRQAVGRVPQKDIGQIVNEMIAAKSVAA